MSIRSKLFLGLLPGILLVVTLGILGYLSLQVVMRQAETIERAYKAQDALQEVRNAVLSALVPPNDYLLTGDTTQHERFTILAAEVETYFSALQEFVPPDELAEIYEKWRQIQVLADQILALPNPEESAEGKVLMRQMYTLALELVRDLNRFEEEHERQIAAAELMARQVRNRAVFVLLLGLSVFTLGGLAFAWLFSGALARPIIALTRSAEALAHGDFDARVTVRGNDEIARLSQTFNIMASSLQKRLEEQKIVTRIVQALNASHDIPTVFQTIASDLHQLVSFECASVALVDNPDDPTYFTIYTIVDHGEIALQVGETMALADSAATPDVMEKRPHRTDDLSTEEAFPVEEKLCRAGHRSRLCLPLIVEGQVIGALNLGSTRPAAFAEANLSALEQVAAALAAALNQARLQQELEESLQRRTAEAKALNAIAATAVQASDLEEVLNTALTHLLSVLKMDAGGVYLSSPDDPQELHLIAHQGISEELADMVRHLSAHTGSTGQVYRQGYPVVLEDLSAHASEDTRPIVERYGWRAFAAVPLRFGDEVLGVLAVSSHARRRLSREDVDFLQAVADQLGSAVANARVRERLQRHLKQVQTLATFTEKLNELLDTEAIVQTAAQQIATLSDVDGAEIHLLDEDGRLRLAGAWGLDEEFVRASHHYRFAVGEGIPGRAFAARSPIYVEDASTDERYLRRELARQAGYKSLLCVPILGRNTVLGTLMLYSRQYRKFTPAEESLLMATSAQIAVALERAQLHEQIKAQRIQEQRTLLRLSQALLGEVDMQRVLDETVQVAAEALKVEFAAIALLDEDGDHFSGRAGVGWPKEVMEQAQHIPLAANTGLGHAIRTGVPVRIQDEREEQRFPPPAWVQEMGIVSSLMVPMIIKGRPIGGLVVNSRVRREWSEDEVRLLSLIAHQAAQALEGARLYAQVQERAEELTALYNLSLRLADALDPAIVCERATAEAAKALHADMCMLAEFDRERGEVRGLLPAYGLPDELVRHFAYKVDETIIRIWDLTKKSYFILSDPEILPPHLRELARQVDVQSLLAARVMAGGQLLGIIFVAEKGKKRRFDENDARLLAAYGQQAAIALARARAYQMAQRRLEELEAAYRVVQQALQLRDDMIRNVSHELRTPLTAIRGYLELLLDGFLGEMTEEQAHAVEIMYKNTERLQFMVERLLMLQSVQAKDITREPIHVPSWLEEVVERWQPTFQEANKTLVLELAPDIADIEGERSLLDQVMDNLIHNALKFSPEGKQVLVRAWNQDDHVIIEVEDQGVGIPADKLAHIFEKFYQVDASTTRRFEGMGIGLALCKEIVERHGGRIWAESEGEGKGSTFYVALPAKPSR